MKYLPNKKLVAGFTLIELLVVIAIIAIISVVAITLYSNVQMDARDGKRRSELEAISNALEVNKATAGYQPLVAATMFGGGTFPGGGATALDPSNYPYCISTGANNAVAANFTTAPACNGAGGTAGYSLIDGTTPAAGSSSYRVCTRLENRGTAQAFCRTSVQ